MLSRRSPDLRSERGVMLVLFAILLPLFLIIGSVVLSTGSWYTHGKHLQTKVDAAAFAGGGSWAFPCASDIDANIESFARQYVGQHTKADGTPYAATTYNPQVGKVQGDQIHVVLNGPDWYDGDTNPNPTEPVAAGNLCRANTLDVKGTEQDSPLLWGWLPFYPDIKKKARVEIQEVEGLNGLLPIAVRAPEPVSAAAVFYDESPTAVPLGRILAVKYFVRNSSIFGLPANLQGWSSYNTEDTGTWASFVPAGATGVAVAVSFRGACNTNLPNPNNNIRTSAAPCFEDTGFTTINQLCNQGSSTQIVNCYYSNTGAWPNENVRSGLHFIRGYPNGTVTNGPPQLRSSYLSNVSCSTNGYFNARPNGSCSSRLAVSVDLGSVTENPPPNPPNNTEQTRRASNVSVTYRLVREDGTTYCDYGANCELQAPNGNATGTVTYSTTGSGSSPDLPLSANSRGNAVAIQIRVKTSTVIPNPGACGVTQGGFVPGCRWFHTGSGQFGTSVEPTNAQILAAPVQRAFRGNSLASGSIQWLRLTADQTCDGTPDFIDNEAASQATGANRCFFVDMGLKGGIAQDQDEEPILFNDGTGSSQMGGIDCDPDVNEGQVLIDGVIKGCGPWYAPNGFDTIPLCPAPNSIFSLPNPGPPFTDWPPLECIKTRTTSQMNQLERGLDNRLFGSNNAPCPADSATGPVKGRNYWHRDNNLYDGANFADNGPPATGNNLRDADPRLVTIFLAPTEAFTGPGQNTYPITGFIAIYITGYGRISGTGSLSIDDPCPGSQPPSDLDLSGGSSGGYAIWGHILKHVVPGPNATPSGRICQPTTSNQPCVPVLVE